MREYIAFLVEATILDRPLLDEVAGALVDIVRTSEPNTTVYEWGVSSTGEELSIHERYKDSDSALAHLSTFAAFSDRFARAVSLKRFRVFGSPSDVLREALATFDPEYVGEIAGFSR